MPIPVEANDTPEMVAQKLLGDARLTHEIEVMGWGGKGPLPVGAMAYIKGERIGPPSKNWTKG